MADVLFDPPRQYDLPLSKGADLHVDFVYMPLVVDGSGDPVLDADGKQQFAEAPFPAGMSGRGG